MIETRSDKRFGKVPRLHTQLKSMIQAGFGKGPTLVGPLGVREKVSALLAPEVSLFASSTTFLQPLEASPEAFEYRWTAALLSCHDNNQVWR